MPFQSGNKLGQGRPKKAKAQAKDWAEAHPYAVAELMQVLYDEGIRGDIDSAKYVIDRIRGKPKISVDSRVKHELELTAEDIWAIRQLSERENEAFISQTSPLQLEGGKDAAE